MYILRPLSCLPDWRHSFPLRNCRKSPFRDAPTWENPPSATPGKTATINFYRLDSLRLVDLPGYGYAKVSDDERRRWSGLIEGYFDDDRDMRLVFHLLDIRHTPSKDDYQMLEYMVEREIPFVVVLTKADKLNKSERAKRLAAFEKELADYEGVLCIPFSAMNGEGISELVEIIDQVTQE